MIYAALALAFASGYIACLWRYDPERLRGWGASARQAYSRAADAVRQWRARRAGK